jgi:hypothetical protein
MLLEIKIEMASIIAREVNSRQSPSVESRHYSCERKKEKLKLKNLKNAADGSNGWKKGSIQGH